MAPGRPWPQWELSPQLFPSAAGGPSQVVSGKGRGRPQAPKPYRKQAGDQGLHGEAAGLGRAEGWLDPKEAGGWGGAGVGRGPLLRVPGRTLAVTSPPSSQRLHPQRKPVGYVAPAPVSVPQESWLSCAVTGDNSRFTGSPKTRTRPRATSRRTAQSLTYKASSGDRRDAVLVLWAGLGLGAHRLSGGPTAPGSSGWRAVETPFLRGFLLTTSSLGVLNPLTSPPAPSSQHPAQEAPKLGLLVVSRVGGVEQGLSPSWARDTQE